MTEQNDHLPLSTPSREQEEEDALALDARGWRRDIARVDQQKKKGSPKWFWLVATMVFFVLLQGIDEVVTTLTILVPAILFHELGHFLAMRVCGYTDVSIFFIPMFGAATTGKEANASQTKRAFIALMGPAPGIVLGIVLLIVGDMSANQTMKTVVQTLLLLNVFNLLPIKPLDGGRLIEATLTSRFSSVAILFSILSPVAMMVIGFALESTVLGILGVVLLWGSTFEIKVSRLTGRLRREGFDTNGLGVDGLSDRQLMTLIARVREVFSSVKDEELAATAKKVAHHLSVPKSSVGATLGMLLAYGLMGIVGVIGFLILMYVGIPVDPVVEGRPVSQWVVLLDSDNPADKALADVTLKAALDSEDWSTKVGTARAFVTTTAGRHYTVPALVSKLEQELDWAEDPGKAQRDSSLTEEYLKALAAIGPEAKRFAPNLIDVVTRTWNHSDLILRGAATVILWQLGQEALPALPALQAAIERERDPSVKADMVTLYNALVYADPALDTPQASDSGMPDGSTLP